MKWLAIFLIFSFNSFAHEGIFNDGSALKNNYNPGITKNGNSVLIAMNGTKATRVNTPDQTECTVCYEAYEKGSANLKQLECGHTMCADCLDTWKAANNGRLTCPYCRKLDPKVYSPAKFCGSVKKQR